VVKRLVLFAIAFVLGYRAAYLVVDTVGQAAIRFPWRESPGMLARGATAGLRGRVIEARAAIDEGKQTARQRERELRAENSLRPSS
jgi:hypothetical protein